MKVSRILSQVMVLTDLTQAQLARALGVSQGTISKWVSDLQSPNKRQWDAVEELMTRDPRLRHLIKENGSETVEVPLISWVSAGRLADAQTQIPLEEAPLLTFAHLGQGDFFALRVEGDSMDRLSPDGSIIVVDRAERTLTKGRCYVFSVRGETTYKRWHDKPPYLAPFSTNPSNEPIFVPKRSDFGVIGRVRRTVLDL